jgi:hypothetical protein
LAALGISFVGEQITRLGFSIVQPESVIGEEIQKDPTSPIALAAAIRAKSRGAGIPMAVRLLLPVLAAGVMAAVDPRRRPAFSCVAYGVALLTLYGWSTGHSPAFAPLVPSTTETAAALAITVLSALGGAALARRLADALQPTPPAPAAAAVPVTSPAR